MGLGRPSDTHPPPHKRGRENTGGFLQVLRALLPAQAVSLWLATRGRARPQSPLDLRHQPSPAGPGPTVHPIQSPQNRFCVLTLDPETLPAIATTLIDVLFYTHRWALVGIGPHNFVPKLLPTTFCPPLGSAVLCPVRWLGFPAACDTPVPSTEVQARSRSHSWSPLPTLAWAGPPELCPGQALWAWGKILFVTLRVVILSRPQPYQQVRALRRGMRAGGQEGLPRAACASPFAGMEPGWEVELAEHLRLPSSAAPLGRQPLAVPDPVPSPSLPSLSSKATSPSSWMLRHRKSK